MAASCSTLHNHLDPISLKFKSQCSDTTFCSAAENGTCIPRKCRRDEFPFGYSYQDVLPPLCLPGTFCPDEGSGCLPLVFIGGACQLNRDEQCALPPDMTDPDQVLCLGSVCTYSDVDTGRPCIADTTTYTDVFDDQHFTSTIIRDNCQKPQYYCEQVSMTCEPAKQLGFSCSIDNECQLVNDSIHPHPCLCTHDRPRKHAMQTSAPFLRKRHSTYNPGRWLLPFPAFLGFLSLRVYYWLLSTSNIAKRAIQIFVDTQRSNSGCDFPSSKCTPPPRHQKDIRNSFIVCLVQLSNSPCAFSKLACQFNRMRTGGLRRMPYTKTLQRIY